MNAPAPPDTSAPDTGLEPLKGSQIEAIPIRPALMASAVVHLVTVLVVVFGLPHIDMTWLEEKKPEQVRVDVVFFGTNEDPRVAPGIGTVTWEQNRDGLGSGRFRGDSAHEDRSASPDAGDGKMSPQAQQPDQKRSSSAAAASASDAKPSELQQAAAKGTKTEQTAKPDGGEAKESSPRQPFQSAPQETAGQSPDKTAPSKPMDSAVSAGTLQSKDAKDAKLAANGAEAKAAPKSGEQSNEPEADAQALNAAASAVAKAAQHSSPAQAGKAAPSSAAGRTGVDPNATAMALTAAGAPMLAAGGNTTRTMSDGRKAAPIPRQVAQASAEPPLGERQGNMALKMMLQQLPGVDEQLAQAIVAPDKVTPLPPNPRRQMVVDRIRKAADRGYAHAQYGLARRELLGQGVPRDPSAAVDHLEKAARQGHADAQLTLGYLAARGYGMKQDLAEAKLWWTLSAARGNEHAARAAALIEPSLNSQELIKSRRLVSEWRSVLDEPSTDPANPSAPKKAKIQDAVAKGDVAELRALVARGEDADGRDIEGRTALINASWRGDPMMVDSLLEFGADPDVYDKGGRSAINWASSNGHAGVVEKLIKSGVEVDVPDAGGRTALIRAVINGHTDVVKALVAGNANLGTKDKDGMTAADYAKKQNYADILQILQSRR